MRIIGHWIHFSTAALEVQGSLDESNEIFTTRFCNVNFEDFSSTQLALPAEMGGLGCHPHHY